MALHRLLGFHTSVPDPDALAAFYGELGLSRDGDAWTGSDGGAAVSVAEGPFRRLDSVAIGCDDDADITAIARRLTDGGASPDTDGTFLTVRDAASRVAFTVRPAAPETETTSPTPLVEPNAPGAIIRRNARAAAVQGAARPPRRLGHLVIGTPDLAATRSLLVDGLGLRVSDEIDGIIHFLRCSTDHHNVALVHSPVPILQHYSWECDDIDHLGHTATALYRTDPSRHTWGIGRHFAGSNFYWYLRDPAGAFLELYSDLDRITDDEAWAREGRTEFGLEHVANAWGPDIPVEFIVPTDLDELTAAWAAGD